MVAIQGQQASFHDIAAKSYFGNNLEIVACKTFLDTFQHLQTGKSDKAVVAIENSLYGSINEVYDLLLTNKFWIEAEVYLRIEQCLIGLPGARIEKIKEVHSQREALGQCQEYLDNVLAQALRFEHYDTAASVADIKLWNDPTKAAIASRLAAELYELPILASEIETHKQNYTRFVVISPETSPNPKANKTSLILGVADQQHAIGDKPGALYHALGAFAKRKINLTKLQSRPFPGKAWHYIFYLDVDCGLDTPSMQAALDNLSKLNCNVTILGSYVSGR